MLNDVTAPNAPPAQPQIKFAIGTVIILSVLNSVANKVIGKAKEHVVTHAKKLRRKHLKTKAKQRIFWGVAGAGAVGLYLYYRQQKQKAEALAAERAAAAAAAQAKANAPLTQPPPASTEEIIASALPDVNISLF